MDTLVNKIGKVIGKIAFSATLLLPTLSLAATYQGLWYELPQYFGEDKVPKYSGAMGTATTKHRPLAIYSDKHNKTFFTYGGLDPAKPSQMAIYVGCYNHSNKRLCSNPTLVTVKPNVLDQHDNASILIDKDGYIWVYVSGRNTSRPGLVYKSRYQGSISVFDQVTSTPYPALFAYPQPWLTETNGKVLLHTQYTNGRELYITQNNTTTKMVKGGHYAISYTDGDRIVMAYNSHVNNHPDYRTNVYFMESFDGGRTWKNRFGDALPLPLEQFDSRAALRDGYRNTGYFTYLKDIKINQNGEAVVLFTVSKTADPTNFTHRRSLIKVIVHRDGRLSITTVGSADVVHGRFEENHNYSSAMIDSLTGHVFATGYEAGYSMRDRAGGNIYRFWGNVMSGIQVTYDHMQHHNFLRDVYKKTPNSASDFSMFWASGHPTDNTIPSQLHYYGGSTVHTMH
ncbi:BNR repeat-containing protein [Aestuariibacter sp. AA17]|uniref:BNR repeat-containing protein n=1 Tax=Fluctibacter corallii TaxID=2984329 RepID=A0ABT3AAB4_9ALTE|nr:BNR repeat-containing protein [Aestuariibacter sp. AA17]MCV2885527.1 BNR repeat-containing protein [Aestuariibacter sp. AA17]